MNKLIDEWVKLKIIENNAVLKRREVEDKIKSYLDYDGMSPYKGEGFKFTPSVRYTVQGEPPESIERYFKKEWKYSRTLYKMADGCEQQAIDAMVEVKFNRPTMEVL